MNVASPLGLAEGERTPKRFRRGTHRLVMPEDTLERVAPFLPAMGITRIANVTGLDYLSIPVVMVCRPNSRSLAVSQGKGLDLPAAMASGVMESIEAYHAEHITLPLKLNSYEELRYTHVVLEPQTLPLIEGSRFHPFHRILWIEGYDLMRRENVWLPHELVHLDYTLPLPSGSGCFSTTSNGLASGNHLLEAISHGVTEVIERDALTLWQRMPEENRHRKRLDPASIDDPDCRLILEMLDAAEIAVALWDISSDIEVPVVLAQLIEQDQAKESAFGWAGGTGCHPARDIALLRAVTEAAQARLTQIAGSRDDLERRHYRRHPPATLARVRETIKHQRGAHCFADVPSHSGESFEDDIAWLLERLRARDIARVVVVDLTRSEFELAVVRVVIPDLEDGVETPNYRPRARANAIGVRS